MSDAVIPGLDLNKEPGNNGVLPSFIKLFADELESPLLRMFNLALSTDIFPFKQKDSYFQDR
jgi:hypothetical protein